MKYVKYLLITGVAVAVLVALFRMTRSDASDASSAKKTGPAVETHANALPTDSGEPAVKASRAVVEAPKSRNEMVSTIQDSSLQGPMAAQARIVLDREYAEYFQSQSLTPERLTTLRNLLTEKYMALLDSVSVAFSSGIDPVKDSETFMQRVADAADKVDVQIQALLGAKDYALYQSYSQTIPARNTASLLTDALRGTPEPLREEQLPTLTQYLARNGVPALPDRNPLAPLNYDLGVLDLKNNHADIKTSGLSQNQVASLEAVMKKQKDTFVSRQQMIH